MRGLLRHVYTRVYFASDPRSRAIPSCARPVGTPADAAGAAVPASVGWAFEIRLQGTDGAVFFDPSSRLIEALATTEELSAIFSDDAVLQAVLSGGARSRWSVSWASFPRAPPR
jgi:hypothetical protein